MGVVRSRRSLQYLDKSMLVFNGNAVYTAPGGFRLETSIDKSILDTFYALDNDISVFTWSESADIPICKKFILITGGDSRSFSDGNERTGCWKSHFVPPVGGFVSADGTASSGIQRSILRYISIPKQ